MKILVSLVAVLAVARATRRNYLPPETEASNGYLGQSNQVELAPYEDNVPSGEYLSNPRDKDLSGRVYLPPGPQNAYLPVLKNSLVPTLTSDSVEKTYLSPSRPQNAYVPPGSPRTKSKGTYSPSSRPQSTYLSTVGPQINHSSHTSSNTKPKNMYLPTEETQTNYLPPGPTNAVTGNTYLSFNVPRNTYLPPVRSQITYLPPGPANTEPRNSYLSDLTSQNIYSPRDVPNAKSENTYLPLDEPRNAYLTPKLFNLGPGNTYLPPKSTKGTYLNPPSSWNTPQRSNLAPSQEYHSTEENFTRQSSRTSSSWTSSSGNSNIVSAWSKAKWMVNGESTREHTGTNQYDGQSLHHSAGYGYPHTDEIVNAKYDYQYRVNDSKSGNDFEHVENRDGDTVWGTYSVVLPDGRKQTVRYTADKDGYKPNINYEDTEKATGKESQGDTKALLKWYY